MPFVGELPTATRWLPNRCMDIFIPPPVTPVDDLRGGRARRSWGRRRPAAGPRRGRARRRGSRRGTTDLTVAGAEQVPRARGRRQRVAEPARGGGERVARDAPRGRGHRLRARAARGGRRRRCRRGRAVRAWASGQAAHSRSWRSASAVRRPPGPPPGHRAGREGGSRRGGGCEGRHGGERGRTALPPHPSHLPRSRPRRPSLTAVTVTHRAVGPQPSVARDQAMPSRMSCSLASTVCSPAARCTRSTT